MHRGDGDMLKNPPVGIGDMAYCCVTDRFGPVITELKKESCPSPVGRQVARDDAVG
jgi:hypothetical protein